MRCSGETLLDEAPLQLGYGQPGNLLLTRRGGLHPEHVTLHCTAHRGNSQRHGGCLVTSDSIATLWCSDLHLGIVTR